MFQSLSAEIDRVKKENDNMQFELRPVLHLIFCIFTCTHLGVSVWCDCGGLCLVMVVGI